ncbi:hypothetical protein [Frigidibacter sp. ROC022]|uniref:hypothetical protein n=1 Tax=Frigidibacter sp. ROC022 TaxID=2971796 RepID=UPI00215A4226|nr:hypothetical protein [Frigidibacter sp. ROC022]MCR8726609.1 hypothetical protein [Frigidibacter sp. ROC022]
MRQAIINSLDILIWIMGGLIALGGVVGGIMVLAQGEAMGLVFIIGALLYAIIFMGMFFLIIGMHNNTRRTAEAVEKLAMR